MLLDAWNPGFIEVARGVEDTTASRDWTVLISNSARDPEREKTYLRLFAEERLAGLIVIPQDPLSDDLRRMLSSGTPVVVVDRAESGEGMSVDGRRRHRRCARRQAPHRSRPPSHRLRW